METLTQKLRMAYDIIANASTSDIGTYWLSVEEGLTYLAEALDMVEQGGE